MRSFFRYPGGKSKFVNLIDQKIESILNQHKCDKYFEPFFGGGGAGLHFIEKFQFSHIWLNDKDFALSCLWNAVINEPEKLKEYILSYKPTPSDFYRFQDDLRDCQVGNFDTFLGFKKLAIHQISFSGLGVMAGGPIGGEHQKSKYKVSCRWSPKRLCKCVDKFNHLLKNINLFKNTVTHVDFLEIISLADENTLLYLDPPYFVKGDLLYQYCFSPECHIHLMNVLTTTKAKWVLSYDDCPKIREMYNWCPYMTQLDVNYSISKSTKKVELLISNIC